MYCWSSNLITCPEGIHNFVGSKNVTPEKKEEDESGNLFPCQAACPVWEARPRASTALGWEAEGWRGVCLHPASISITELDWGKQKIIQGQTDRQPAMRPCSQHGRRSFILPGNRPKNGSGRVRRGAAQLAAPAQVSFPITSSQGQQQKEFSAGGSRAASLCSAGSKGQWLARGGRGLQRLAGWQWQPLAFMYPKTQKLKG